MPYIFKLSLHVSDGYMPPFLLVGGGTFILFVTLFVWFPTTLTQSKDIKFIDLNSHTEFSIVDDDEGDFESDSASINSSDVEDDVLSSTVASQRISTPVRYSHIYELCRDGNVWILLAIVFYYNGQEIVLGGWLPELMYSLGFPDYASYASSLFWGGMLAGRLVNIIVERWFRGIKRIAVLLQILVVIEVGIPLLVVIFPNPPFSLVLIFLSGTSMGGVFPHIIALASSLFMNPLTSSTSIIMGLILLVSNLGKAIIPFITGIVGKTF